MNLSFNISRIPCPEYVFLFLPIANRKVFFENVLVGDRNAFDLSPLEDRRAVPWLMDYCISKPYTKRIV